MSVRIALLADHPELLADLAASYEREWPQWYGVHGDATTDLRERCRHTGLPICLIALDEGKVIGALALAANAISVRPELTPCVIGFWVEAVRRNRGIGSLLLKAACEHARASSVARLYTCTETVPRLFVREGWVEIDAAMHEGKLQHIFEKAL